MILGVRVEIFEKQGSIQHRYQEEPANVKRKMVFSEKDISMEKPTISKKISNLEFSQKSSSTL